MLHFSYINSLQILHTYKPLNQFQKFKKLPLELHIAFITLVECTLFTGTCLCEFLITLLTAKWFLLRMYSFMIL